MRAIHGKNGRFILVAAVASWFAISCGGNGASNNDQGMSVTLLGLFGSTSLTNNNNGGGGAGGASLGQLGCGQLPAGVSGGYIQLGAVGSQTIPTLSEDVLSGSDFAGNYLSVIGVQNNLYGQAYRAERVLIEYSIPGASIQPPSVTIPISLIAGPAESASRVGGGANNTTTTNPGIRRPIFTSLPPSFSNLCNRSLSQVPIVPSSTRDWLIANRGQLPAAPYFMEVNIRVAGISSAGDEIETNDVTVSFDVIPESFIIPVTASPSPTSASAVSGIDPSAIDPTEAEAMNAMYRWE
jgi:hypothetical protein